MSDVEKAESAGEQYAQDQMMSSHFNDWVFSEMHAATDPKFEAAPGLETKAIAKSKAAAERLARRMLQQLWWDIKRDISDNEITKYLKDAGVEGTGSDRDVSRAFYAAVQSELEAGHSRSWLADEVIQPFAKSLAKKKK